MPQSLYFENASIQKKLYEDILITLKQNPINPKTILDLGCATGEMTQKIAALFPHAQVIGIDKNEDRIRYATQRFQAQKNLHFQKMDIEDITLSGPFDLILSNASLQWVSNFETSWKKIETLLSDSNGQFHIQLFGQNTYHELQDSLNATLSHPIHISALKFPKIDEIIKIYKESKKSTKITQKNIIKKYNGIKDLFSEIKKTNTRGPEKIKKIWVKSEFDALEKWFIDKFGQVSVTYQTIIMSTLK